MVLDKGVELFNVRKKIKNKTIINDISFESKRGEILGLLGPNGAGKTTIIKMMVGLSKITSGDIHIAGQSIKTNKIEALKKIGAVVETPTHYDYMSGYQNLQYFSKLHKNVSVDRINEVVSIMKLDEAIHNKVTTYSLGMKQRLGLAQSVLHKPVVLILDEPTNGLDPMGIKDLRNYIKELSTKMNVSVIVSSHLLSEMELLCDRIVIMQKGEIIQDRNIRKNDSFEIDNLDVTLLDFYVSDANKSVEVLEKKISNGNFLIKSNNNFSGNLNNEEVSIVVKELVYNDVNIFRIINSKSTLEEDFVDMITKNGELSNDLISIK